MNESFQTASPLLIGDRPFPHSRDMEKAFLSCVLQDPDNTFDRVSNIPTEDFYIPAHKRVWGILLGMVKLGKPIDLISVANELGQNQMLADIGGDDFLRDLINCVPSIANFDSYVSSVITSGKVRRLIGLSSEIAGRCFEASEDQYSQVVSDAERSIIQISDNAGTNTEAVFLKDCVDDACKAVIGEFNRDPDFIGMSTGFKNIDEIIDGIKTGDGGYVLLGARPSIGKTTLALNLANLMCHYGYQKQMTTGIFMSLETGGTTITKKFLYMLARVNARDIKIGKFKQHELITILRNASERISGIPLILDDSGGFLTDIVHRIRSYVRKYDVKFVFIDYVQLVRLRKPGPSREQDVALISDTLKKLGKDLGVAMIVLAQLTRGAEGRKPAISDLRESGSLEQDADIIGLLTRERETDVENAVNEYGAIETDVVFCKNRNGETGVAHLDFYAGQSLFQDRVKYNPQH